jgi:hypothetical protein
MSPILSGAYATPLQLELVPSRRLQLLLAASHAGGLMLLPFTGLGAVITLPLAALLCAAGWQAWRSSSALPSRRFVQRLTWEAGDRVELTRRDGMTEQLQLQAEAFVTPWLVVLKLQNRRHHRLYLPVLPDMLPRERYRRLRVRLRLEIPRLAGAHP